VYEHSAIDPLDLFEILLAEGIEVTELLVGPLWN
jgi:hypothetical protein